MDGPWMLEGSELRCSVAWCLPWPWQDCRGMTGLCAWTPLSRAGCPFSRTKPLLQTLLQLPSTQPQA